MRDYKRSGMVLTVRVFAQRHPLYIVQACLAAESVDEKLRHYLADGTEIVFPFIQSSVDAL